MIKLTVKGVWFQFVNERSGGENRIEDISENERFVDLCLFLSMIQKELVNQKRDHIEETMKQSVVWRATLVLTVAAVMSPPGAGSFKPVSKSTRAFKMAQNKFEINITPEEQ